MEFRRIKGRIVPVRDKVGTGLQVAATGSSVYGVKKTADAVKSARPTIKHFKQATQLAVMATGLKKAGRLDGYAKVKSVAQKEMLTSLKHGATTVSHVRAARSLLLAGGIMAIAGTLIKGKKKK